MKQFDIPTSRDIPAARIADEGDEFGVYLPRLKLIWGRKWISRHELRDPMNWVRCGSLEQFVIGLVSGKFKFGFSSEIEASITADVRIGSCWRCGREHGSFSGVSIALPETYSPTHPPYYRSLAEIGDAEDSHLKNAVISEVNRRLPSRHGKPLSMRYSKTVRSSYLSNGCGHCGALIGNFFLRQGRIVDEVDIQWKFPVRAKLTDFQQMLGIVEHWSFMDPNTREHSVDTKMVRHRRSNTISINDAAAIMAGMRSF